MTDDKIISLGERLLQKAPQQARQTLAFDEEAQNYIDQLSDKLLSGSPDMRAAMDLKDVSSFLLQMRLKGETALPSLFHVNFDKPSFDISSLRAKVAAWKKQDWDGLRHVANFPMFGNQKHILYEITTHNALEQEATLLEAQEGRNFVSANTQSVWHRVSHDGHRLLSLRNDDNEVVANCEMDREGVILWAEDAKARTVKGGPSLISQFRTGLHDTPYTPLRQSTLFVDELTQPSLVAAVKGLKQTGELFYVLQRRPTAEFVAYTSQLGEKVFAEKLHSLRCQEDMETGVWESAHQRMLRLYPETSNAISQRRNVHHYGYREGQGPKNPVAPPEKVTQLVENWLSPYWLSDKITGASSFDAKAVLPEGAVNYLSLSGSHFDSVLGQFLAKEGMAQVLDKLCDPQVSCGEKRTEEHFIKAIIADMTQGVVATRKGQKLPTSVDFKRLDLATDPKVSYDDMRERLAKAPDGPADRAPKAQILYPSFGRR